MESDEKLDTIKAVGSAYFVLFANFLPFAIIVGGWFALGVAILSATLFAMPIVFQQFPELADVVLAWPEAGRGLLVIAPVAIVAIFGTLSLIVAWHRLIILNVKPLGPFPTGFGGNLRYLVRLIAVFLIPIAPFAGAAYFAGSYMRGNSSQAASGILIVPIVFGLVCVSLIVVRLSLVLPAAAIGDRAMTFSRAWQMSKGNSWRLFWGAFLAALPFNVVSKITENLLKAVPQMEGTTSGIVIGLVGGAADVMGYVVAAGFLSNAYLHFVRVSEPGVGPIPSTVSIPA